MVKDLTMGKAISRFAAEATKKLSAIGAQGEPEDQIRSPLEGFIHDLADICRIGRNNVVAIGESSIAISRDTARRSQGESSDLQ